MATNNAVTGKVEKIMLTSALLVSTSVMILCLTVFGFEKSISIISGWALAIISYIIGRFMNRMAVGTESIDFFKIFSIGYLLRFPILVVSILLALFIGASHLITFMSISLILIFIEVFELYRFSQRSFVK